MKVAEMWRYPVKTTQPYDRPDHKGSFGLLLFMSR